MKEGLQKVIDEILIRTVEIKRDADVLYLSLEKRNCLSQDEVDSIVAEKTTTQKFLRIFTLLKNKSEDVFFDLQKICNLNQQFDLLDVIRTTLNEFGHDNLIWNPSINSNINLFATNELLFHAIITSKLKEHYKKDLNYIENYFQIFDVRAAFDLNIFYNQNIIINDKYKQLKTTIKSFDELFSNDCNQFTIVAGAGYGKSTFVHEIARQWAIGKNYWTKKFSFLFLFRLVEVNEIHVQSLQSLLTKCLDFDESTKIVTLLGDAECLSRCLFIFDGLDELQHQFCKEIEDIIFCKGAKLPHVIITSRPCSRLDELPSINLHIELLGYTENGVAEQLKKFSIDPNKIQKNLTNILKVPLFNTIFCITHKETAIGCLNICTAIENFVHFACNRYRNSCQQFTDVKQHELLLILGQAAQNKFSFIKKIFREYPNVTSQILSNAIDTGLIYHKSTADDFNFAHQTIAEYCAAYFFVKTSNLAIKELSTSGITFSEPHDGFLYDHDLFSCFLSHFSIEYKLFLWNNFHFRVPFLTEYESLPNRQINGIQMDIQFVPISDQKTVLDKIDYLPKNNFEKDTIRLWGGCLESGKRIDSISKVNRLQLTNFTLNQSPIEFFNYYNIPNLIFNTCIYNDSSKVGDDINDNAKNDIVLKYLEIGNCDLTMARLLSYVMKHCKKLNTFILDNSKYPYLLQPKITKLLDTRDVSDIDCCGNCWITELRNNENLLYSMKSFELNCKDPLDLTNLFQTLGYFLRLKTLKLKVNRYLMKSEVDALKLSFKKKLKHLTDVSLHLKDENGKEIRLKKQNVKN